MAKIVQDTAQGKMDVKRLPLPGVKVEDDCPSCGKKWTFDGDTDSINYPIIGDKVNLYGNCECGESWDVHVTVGIKISL